MNNKINECKYSNITYLNLVELLMDVINQACQLGNSKLHHSYMGVYEQAFDELISMGLMEETPNGKGFKLLWDKLQSLKSKATDKQ